MFLLAGCASGDGGFTFSSVTTTTKPTSGGSGTTTPSATSPSTTTTTEVHADARAVDPASVPDGFQVVQRKGIGVGLAVPRSWTIVDLDSSDLTAAQRQLIDTDPQLAGMIGRAGGLLDSAKALAAGDPADATRPTVSVVQLDLSLPTIPKLVADQMRNQMAALGATDVRSESLVVPGLSAGARALRLDATLNIASMKQRLQMVIVPASAGIVVVTVRADAATTRAIVSTIAAS